MIVTFQVGDGIIGMPFRFSVTGPVARVRSSFLKVSSPSSLGGKVPQCLIS